MATVSRVGDVTIRALSDGTVHLPPLFYPGLDFDAHPELLADDGTYHIPVGCFLIEGDGFTVLVDAGLGPDKIAFPAGIAAEARLADPPQWIAEGGLLPDALALAGVDPADIDVVFLTHLHADHISWVAPGGELFFPNAEVIYGDADSAPPVAPAPGELKGRAGLEIARAAGRVRTITAPAVTIAPGVAAHHTPGHTPGHYVVSVSSRAEQAYLLGDVVHHPLQLTDSGIWFASETTPEHARATREALFDTLAGRDISIGMTHFPGLEFQRITAGERRSWATA